MLSKRASLGLSVITTIASASKHSAITADYLASAMGVSLSYVEGILKDAREFGFIQAKRGNGGGYMAVAYIGSRSIWDVVECFKLPNKPSKKAYSTPEWRSTNLIEEQAFQFEKEFLQKFSISQLVPEWIEPDFLKQTKSIAMNFKQLPEKVKPAAPNSVFDLSNFLNLKVT